MEASEKEHIRVNLSDLVKNTKFNTDLSNKLEGAGLLSADEVEEIQMSGTKANQANNLYKIIITRTNAFDALEKALRETSQTGAADILIRIRGDVARPPSPPNDPQRVKKLQNVDKETTLKVYWKGSELASKDDAKTILNDATHKLTTGVFKNPDVNDVLTNIPGFGFEDIEKERLNQKPVTPTQWGRNFIEILLNRYDLLKCLNTLCNLHKNDQRNYHALIVEVLESLPNVGLRES